MSKINCNIAKDLLPSYIDGLCSEESCVIIEEHLQECPECGNLVRQMKEIQFVTDGGKTSKEIDCFKKIKNNNLKRNILTGFYMAVILISGIGIWIQSVSHATVPVIVYCCLTWAMVSIIYLLFGDFIGKQSSVKSKKINRWFSGISGIMCIYAVILMLLGCNWNIFTDTFHMEMQQIGPFIQVQLLVIVTISFLLYLQTIIVSVKKSEYMLYPSVFSSIGINLSLMMMSFLGNWDSKETILSNLLFRFLALLFTGALLVFMLNIAKTKGKFKKVITYIFAAVTVAGIITGGIIWSDSIAVRNEKVLKEAVQFYYQELASQTSDQSILSNNAANSPACLTLDPAAEEFTFSYDVLSSYFSFGNYEIVDDKLVATTSDGLYHYTFTIIDEKTLVFVEAESSSVILTDKNAGQQIKNGCRFTKEMVGITE